MSVVSIG